MMIQPRNKVTPFLWFDTNAEEAAKLYVSLFVDSKMGNVARWAKGSPYPEGAVMSVSIELAQQEYILFNGGAHFKLDEAFSLFVSCDDQAEVEQDVFLISERNGHTHDCAFRIRRAFGPARHVAHF